MSGRLVKAKQPEVNKRYQCWVKIGGDMELLTVQVKRLYRAHMATDAPPYTPMCSATGSAVRCRQKSY